MDWGGIRLDQGGIHLGRGEIYLVRGEIYMFGVRMRFVWIWVGFARRVKFVWIGVRCVWTRMGFIWIGEEPQIFLIKWWFQCIRSARS